MKFFLGCLCSSNISPTWTFWKNQINLSLFQRELQGQRNRKKVRRGNFWSRKSLKMESGSSSEDISTRSQKLDNNYLIKFWYFRIKDASLKVIFIFWQMTLSILRKLKTSNGMQEATTVLPHRVLDPASFDDFFSKTLPCSTQTFRLESWLRRQIFTLLTLPTTMAKENKALYKNCSFPTKSVTVKLWK